MHFDSHIAWENRVSNGFMRIAYHMYIYTDHRKINTRQQTLDYSFETHWNVLSEKGCHLLSIRVTQRDMQHKSFLSYTPEMYMER